MREGNFTSGPFYLNAGGTFGTIPNDGMQSVLVTLGGTWTDGAVFVYGKANGGEVQLIVPGLVDQSAGITTAGVYSIATGGFMTVIVRRGTNGTPAGTATLNLSSSAALSGSVLGA